MSTVLLTFLLMVQTVAVTVSDGCRALSFRGYKFFKLSQVFHKKLNEDYMPQKTQCILHQRNYIAEQQASKILLA